MLNGPKELVSVVLPVYNGERYIEETIESVLGQSYTNLELLIVDDGSTDETAKLVHRITDSRVKYYFQENQGQSSAINFGVSRTQGPILCFIDADDLWTEDKLSRQLEVLREQPDDLIFAYIQQFLSPDIERREKVVPQSPQPGFSKCTLLLFRRQWDKVGNFTTSVKLGEFIDWYGRAKELGLRYQMINEVLAFRRIHQKNISTTMASHRSDFVKIMKQRIDKKRKSSSSN